MKPATRPNLTIDSEGNLPNSASCAKPQAWDCPSPSPGMRASDMTLLPASKKFVGAFRSNPCGQNNRNGTITASQPQVAAGLRIPLRLFCPHGFDLNAPTNF